MTFMDLRDAANAGRDFTSQLKALHAVAGKDAVLSELVSKLEPYAASPPPTVAQLRVMLASEEANISAPATPIENADWWARIKNTMRPLISVHPLHGGEFTTVEQALDAGDTDSALQAFKDLPEEDKSKLSSWQSRLQARAGLNNALHDLVTHFASPASVSP
jgi:hypothetical protein